MIFVDASALVSMIAREADCFILADRLEPESNRLCSAISLWETAAALCRSYKFTKSTATHAIEVFRQDFGLKLVAIGEPEAALACEAFAQFRKG